MWVTENDNEIVNLNYVRSVYVEESGTGKNKKYNLMAEYSSGDNNVLMECKTLTEVQSRIRYIKDRLQQGNTLCHLKVGN